ncbi:eukaryotic translation initiation factor 3 subunit J [Phascolomyces articulosus]|uniref:Eukaryotic translation initiation factor 3 subunit J n=1 Tax=Phascolomyces articulosus TaxID=60185 RepID=A0AAD5PFP7_9FUNG|nr:eukaryotic translation initiation factor 3 subunit J [Phascolomyces articulosus]
MSDWEDEKDFEVAVPKKSKWDDEDVEDDVKDDWEEESSDEEQKEEKKLPPVRKKVPLAQKIAEKKAAEEERKKEIEAKKAAIRAREDETEEEAFERKQRERQLQIEADMNSATDLFSGASISKDKKPTGSIEDFKPKTRVEYNDYAKRLAEIILANSKSANYGAFLDTLVKEIAVPCKDMDIRKAASSLTAMANEKQRQAKEATKSKKKGKPQLAAAGKSSALDDSSSYRDVYDDFDDFM